MRTTNLAALEAALLRLREADGLLDDTDAGVCLIHLDACISALESRIRRAGLAAASEPSRAANDAAHQLAQPMTDTPGA